MSAQSIAVDGLADGSGGASVRFPSFATGITRTVSQITVSNGSTSGNVTQLAQIFVNGLLDCATRVNPDTAVGGIVLRSSDKLLVTWTGLDAGAAVHAVFSYDDEQQS